MLANAGVFLICIVFRRDTGSYNASVSIQRTVCSNVSRYTHIMLLPLMNFNSLYSNNSGWYMAEETHVWLNIYFYMDEHMQMRQLYMAEHCISITASVLINSAFHAFHSSNVHFRNTNPTWQLTLSLDISCRNVGNDLIVSYLFSCPPFFAQP